MKYYDFEIGCNFCSIKKTNEKDCPDFIEEKVKKVINEFGIENIEYLDDLIKKFKNKITKEDSVSFHVFIDLEDDEKEFKESATKKIKEYFKDIKNERFKQAENEFLTLIKNTNKKLKIVWNENEQASIYIDNFHEVNKCLKDIVRTLYSDLKDKKSGKEIDDFKNFSHKLIKDELIMKLPKMKDLDQDLKDKITKI